MHTQCCKPKSQKLYLGFSRASKYFEEENNPNYDVSQALSVDNFPTRIKEGSLAFKLAKELNKLESTGRVNELFNRYIIEADHTLTDRFEKTLANIQQRLKGLQRAIASK